jgi:secreted Zn-dependent insulinase-like peptidase
MSTTTLDLDHTKSTGDEKNYRVISLSSGLEALLISTKQKGERRGDVNAKAAAAMSVQVGSFADPEVAGKYIYFC